MAGKIIAKLGLAWLCLSLGAAAQAAELIGVRFGPSSEATRIVFDISGEVSYSVSGDRSGNGRLLIDFTALTITSNDLNFASGQGHIQRFGFAKRGAENSQAVFEFKKTAKIKEVFMIAPKGKVKKHRLVVDLVSASKEQFLASLPNKFPDMAAVIEEATRETAGKAPKPKLAAKETATAGPSPVTTSPVTPSQKSAKVASTPDILPVPDVPKTNSPNRRSDQRKVVVIDAGHGGRDPGSQGQSGTLEKTVTLAAALKLEEILKKRGKYKVILTRSDDTRILPDKVEALARNVKADLFISLHADANTKAALRGASVYTLSKKGSARSTKLAKAQENLEVYDLNVGDYDQVVGNILLDKAQDKTSTASSKLAELLITNLSPKTQMLNRSHRTANLRVLLAPDVPAVLLEMAFISNIKDEANLKSPVWRQRTMTVVAKSIDQYFEEYGNLSFAANLTADGR